MGLVKCSGCGQMVSDTIGYCIICGENLGRKAKNAEASSLSGYPMDKKATTASKQAAQENTQQEKQLRSHKPRQICIGDLGTIIVREDDTAYVFETSKYPGQLKQADIDKWKTDVSHWSNIASIVTCNYSYKSHFAALTRDGKVLATGNNEFGQCDVHDWTNIVQVVAGAGCTLGVDAAGHVKTAGQIKENQQDIFSWSNIKKLHIDWMFIYGIDKTGKVHKAGTDYSDVFRVESWSNIVDVIEASIMSNHGDYILGLRTDGKLSVVGRYDGSDRDYNGSERYIKMYRSWSNIKKIVGSRGDVMALRHDGTVLIRPDGSEWKKSVSTWRNIEDIEMDHVHCVGLKRDGTVVIAAHPEFCGNSHQNWRGVKTIATHPHHTLGITNDGTILVADNELKEIQ